MNLLDIISKAYEPFWGLVGRTRNPVPFAYPTDFEVANGLWPDTGSKYATDYKTNEGVYSVVSLLTQKFASIADTTYVYEIKDKKSYKEFKAIDPKSLFNNTKSLERYLVLRQKALEIVMEKGELNDVLFNPNPLQGLYQFLETLYGHKLLSGEGNIYINSFEGMPQEMYPLPANMVGLINNDTNLFDVAGYYLMVNGQVYGKVDKDNLIAWKYFNPQFDATTLSHLRGQAPLDAAKNVLDQSKYSVLSALNMFKSNGARGALFGKNLPRNMSPEQVSTMVQDVNQRINHSSNKGSIAALNGDWGYHNLGMTSVDMQLLQTQNISMQRLCNIFGVPFVLFDATSTNYNTYESAIKQLVMQKMIPEWSSLKTLLNQTLAPKFGKNLLIDFDYTELPEIQKDLKDLNDAVKEAWWLSVNEKRAVMRYPTRKEEQADWLLLPSPYMPLHELQNMSDEPTGNVGGNGTQSNPNNEERL
jgi:HK97 family phage portal protein